MNIFAPFCRPKPSPDSGDLRRLIELVQAQNSILSTIKSNQEKLMSKIDDYIAAQQAFNADIASDFTTISTNTSALNTQIATLTTELASAGLSQSQSDALDALTTAGTALQATADAAAGKTPPAPPSTP